MSNRSVIYICSLHGYFTLTSSAILLGKRVVFEAVIEFKNQLGSGEIAWGDFDLVYRSERLPLYPQRSVNASRRWARAEH